MFKKLNLLKPNDEVLKGLSTVIDKFTLVNFQEFLVAVYRDRFVAF